MKDLAHALDKLKQETLFRTRKLSSSAQQVEPTINGQKVLSFCSNDYLGLANHPKVIERFATAAKEYGVGSGASHLITGHHKSHAALEEELAEFLGCEKVLLFSTGYMANLGVVTSLASRSSSVYADKLNHASLNDAALLSRANLNRYAHRDTQQLEKTIALEKSDDKLILSDGVFSMDGTTAPIEKLQTLAIKYHARLLIDDAHGIGVVGEQGRGCTEDILSSDDILIGTLGKAFGTFGAYVASNQQIIEWIIQKAHSYIYTTALPPAVAEASRTSLKLIQEESWRRETLREHTHYFRSCCEQMNIQLADSITPIQPVIIGASNVTLKLSESLISAGILVPAIRPPTVPDNTSRLRITFCTDHTRNHIDALITELSNAIVNR